MATPQQLAQRLNEGIAHHEAGRLERAEGIYRQVALKAPRWNVVYDLLGRVTEQQGRLAEAEKHFVRSLQLDPKSVSSAVQLASILIGSSRAAQAEEMLRGLVGRLPRSHDAWNAHGYVLKILGRLDEALACHRTAVTLNPEFAEGWMHWGLTLMFTGQNFEALEKQDRALALNPDLVPARYARAQVLHKVYRTAEAITEYERVIAANPRNLEARSYRLFALQTLGSMTPEQVFAEHLAYGSVVGNGPPSLAGYDLSPERRLRVGIVSPDFRTHSCAYFIEPLLSGLNPEEFELYLYHDHFIEDEVSARLKTYAAVWRNIVGQSAAVFEKLIRDDHPDILIDLTGHVGNTIRLPSFAKRLAPVQITYLGYPDTTGVPAMDYRFTDSIADPAPTADALATEKLVRFSSTAWAYKPPHDAPLPQELPCTRTGNITFGCFSAPTKFGDSLFAAWAEILRAVPGSRLLLKGVDFQQEQIRIQMFERLAGAGLPHDRVELLPRTPDTASHLAQYGLVDLALDTFPYTGTTTTCEALWMGRPVVTLSGNRHAARVGDSLLRAVGHSEWIAASVAEYVRIAVGLTQQPVPALQALTAGLRGDMERSALCDYSGQARRFGAALRNCWMERAACRPFA